MNEKVEDGVSRRNVLKGAGALGLGALATMASSNIAGISEAFAADAGHHHHGGSTNQAMTNSIHACIQTGDECTAHCIEMIKSGDTSLIDCMKSVQETVAFCGGFAYISASNSKYLKAMCELAITICSDCQKECEKHAKHAQCKACGEACAACVKECKKHLKA